MSGMCAAQADYDSLDLTRRIDLMVKSEAPIDQVYITGSIEELGFWNPSTTRMNRLNDSTFQYVLQSAPTEAFEYKFTLGTWEQEALDKRGMKYPNFRFSTDVLSVTDSVFGWSSTLPDSPSFVGGVTGEVVYHKDLMAPGLLPRDVLIWLPAGYHEDSERRYPVLYMHDGQNLFDPATSYTGVDWQIDESLTAWIAEGIIEPMIVVGIHNTPERSMEYIDEKGSEMYQDFVIHGIKALVDSLYQTSNAAAQTFTGGSSAGATLAFMLAWQHPDVFGGALCFSPAFNDPDSINPTFNYLDDIRLTPSAPTARFYLYNGGVGLEDRLQAGIDAAVDLLEQKGMTPQQDFILHRDKDAEHNEAAWSQDFGFGLMWLLRKDC
ncbi:MAG: histidine kinase [Flavobacteriales bacterium]|nr:histidine kinase [Flavobacteriales bacterium]